MHINTYLNVTKYDKNDFPCGNDNETEVTKTQRKEPSADITKLADHKVNKHSTIGLDKNVNI